MRLKSTVLLASAFVLVLAPSAWSDFCSQYCSPPAAYLAGYCQAVCSSNTTPLTTGGTDVPFQVHYATNLAIGDSVIDITNTGSSGGNICVNVYAFDPVEELISCCACPVTPNALQSLSVRNDLISNTITPGVPTSVVIKLVATKQLNNSCGFSAAIASSLTLVPGMRAWGTTLHANTSAAAGTYAVTETEFAPAILSQGELNRISYLCQYTEVDGSGFGICNSCRTGGL
jgi:hypothetical protein